MGKEATKLLPIESLRFICAVLIVLLHAGGLTPLQYDNPDIPSKFYVFDTIRIVLSKGLCCVAVPLFFIISGYLFFKKLEKWDYSVWRNKLQKRIRSLFVPYCLWCTIPLVFLFSLHFCKILWFDKTPVNADSLKEWFDSIGGWLFFWDCGTGTPVNGPLWFVRNLILAVLASPLIWLYVRYTKMVGLVFLFLFTISGVSLGILFLEKSIFFFTLGAYFSLNKRNMIIDLKDRKKVTIAIAVPLLLFMTLVYDSHYDIYEFLLKFFELFGSLALVGVVASQSENTLVKKASQLSDTSFFIYVAHDPILIPLFAFVLREILPTDNEPAWIAAYFAMAITIILLLLGLYKAMHTYCPGILRILTGSRG